MVLIITQNKEDSSFCTADLSVLEFILIRVPKVSRTLGGAQVWECCVKHLSTFIGAFEHPSLMFLPQIILDSGSRTRTTHTNDLYLRLYGPAQTKTERSHIRPADTFN